MRPAPFLATAVVVGAFAARAAAEGPPAAPPEQTPLEGTGPHAASALDNINFWGYGEIDYARPSSEPQRAVMDLRRAVFGIGYRFSPRVSFNSEWEVEHGVASSGDAGEFEVEQFYLDFQAADWLTVTAGLFLMPFGITNEHHEPIHFYGVQRNFVETLIIPSTWREGGVSLHGENERGFGFSLGIVTGSNFSGWDFAPAHAPYATAFDLEASGVAPLQATHQELQFANASHFSGYLSANYHGAPGLLVGAAVISGEAVPVASPAGAAGGGDPRVTLWEAHARYSPGRIDLTALYAAGYISNTAAANAANPDSPNPVPASFNGYYVQGAYSVWQNETFRVAPFVRWESYNMGASYRGTGGPVLPAGQVAVSDTPGDTSVWPQNNDRVFTAGANFYVTPQVVVKADYQWFSNNTGFDRLDLGLGLSF